MCVKYSDMTTNPWPIYRKRKSQVHEDNYLGMIWENCQVASRVCIEYNILIPDDRLYSSLAVEIHPIIRPDPNLCESETCVTTSAECN